MAEQGEAAASSPSQEPPSQQVQEQKAQQATATLPVRAADAGLDSDRQVVIDAGAAIHMQRLERFGGSLYTTRGVFAEIKDEQAQALLRTLPQEIKMVEPDPEAVAYSKHFAKLTGDLGVLSHNDLDVIALTVSLHRKAGGAPLRPRPAALGQADESHLGMGGFEWAPKKVGQTDGSSEAGAVSSTKGASCTAAPQPSPAQSGQEHEAECSAGGSQETKLEAEKEGADKLEAGGKKGGQNERSEVPGPGRAEAEEEKEAQEVEESQREPMANPNEACSAEGQRLDSGIAEDEDDDCESDSSGAGEWVTPENIHHFGIGIQPAADLKVTCATGDFAVQNVLLQMGITPITFEGYAVRTVKLWGMVCRACIHFTRDTQKVFCPKCGHATVVRVPIVVDSDGQPKVVHYGRKLRTKGKVYSIPKPQGGRGWKPIFAEDEIKIGGRDREMRHQQRLYDKEKRMHDPFNEDNAARAWWQRSTTSTGRTFDCHAAPKFQAGYGRRNPNQPHFKFPGRKKR